MRAALVVLLAGCNQYYGLDPTRTADAAIVVDPPDRDRDGVLDDVDNCPDVANPGQADLDGDLAGDACDPCSYTFDPALDRDQDGLATAVDNCPAAANAAQDDTDGDGIGDACDPRPGIADAVRCFDDFSTDVLSVWPIASPWQWLGTASSAIIVHSPSSAPPFSIAARASGLDAIDGAVQLELMTPSTNLDAATGLAVGSSSLDNAARCEIVGTGSGLRLRIASDRGEQSQALAFSGQRMLITLVYRVGAPNELACTASLPDGRRQTLTAAPATITLDAIGLIATNASALYRALVIYDAP